MDLDIIIAKANELIAEKDFVCKQENATKLIDEFNTVFPKENLKVRLNLDNYVIGNGDTFSQWCEYKTSKVAQIGGTPGIAKMYHVWSKKELFEKGIFHIRKGLHIKDISRAQAMRIFESVKENILRIVNFAITEQFEQIDEIQMFYPIFRMKIAYLYFPNKFTSIMSSRDIKKACNIFGVSFKDRYPVYSNAFLFQKIREIDFFKNWTGYMIGSLFYSKLSNFIDVSDNDRFLLDEDTSDTLSELESSKEEIEFVEKIANIRKRNQVISKELKKLYNNRCQISGYDLTFKKENGEYYSELHHIIPLGENGSDSFANAIVVSPLIHRMLHYANVSPIDLSQINREILELRFKINNKDYVIKWHKKHFETIERSIED